jgi:hypothetical protein
MPDFWEHLCENGQPSAMIVNGSITHPILKKPQTLVESII